jgi:lipid A 3-O-deacylase
MILGGVVVVVLCCTVTRGWAERPTKGIGQWISQIGVFTGYIQGELKTQDHLEVFPLGLRLGFDLKPFARKFNVDPKGLLEFICEPYVGAITAPDSDIELALPFFLRYSFPLTQKLYPYIEAGTGPYYMSLDTYEQSTYFNFVSQGGGGLTYFFRESWALSVGYRYRHVSNNGIKEPNAGINANVFTAGVSYYF